MLKKTITYTDYNGVTKTEDFYFNLSKAELIDWNINTPGGLEAIISDVIKAKDVPAIINLVKEIIVKAYGEKSPDGKRFIKSKELSDAFTQTEAYSELYMSLLEDPTGKLASDFISGVIPPMTEEQKALADKEVAKMKEELSK